MCNFTKGEWFVVETDNEITVTCKDFDIATVWTSSHDAALMGMSKAMYEMLELSCEMLRQTNGCAEHHTANEIEQLLAKARGEHV